MKTIVFWSLAALNVVLLLALVGRFTTENTAQAQQAVRRSGDYIMVPGRVSGSSNGFLYVVDTGTGLLSAMSFDGQNLSNMQPIDLNRIFEAASGGAGRAPLKRGY